MVKPGGKVGFYILKTSENIIMFSEVDNLTPAPDLFHSAAIPIASTMPSKSTKASKRADAARRALDKRKRPWLVDQEERVAKHRRLTKNQDDPHRAALGGVPRPPLFLSFSEWTAANTALKTALKMALKEFAAHASEA